MFEAIKAFFKNLFQSDNTHMLNLILFGPPGSGKGTQAVKLANKYGLLHISTGDLFRYEMGNDTPLGKEAKSYISKGALVPDSVTIGMLKNKVNANPDVGGYIFDGFPRTIAQAEALNAFLSEKGEIIASLLSLQVEDIEIITRLLERGKSSGRSFSTVFTKSGWFNRYDRKNGVRGIPQRTDPCRCFLDRSLRMEGRERLPF